MRSKPEKFSAVFLFRRKNYDMTDSMEIPLKKKKKVPWRLFGVLTQRDSSFQRVVLDLATTTNSISR